MLPHAFDFPSRLAFLDIETTGLNPLRDEVIEVGVLIVEGTRTVAEHQWLVRPKQPLSPLIQVLTGLDDQQLAGGQPLETVEIELAEGLGGSVVIAHNAAFEQRFLPRVLRDRCLLDSCELAHTLVPQVGRFGLDVLANWAGLVPRQAHRSLSDCRLTYQVLETLLSVADRQHVQRLASLLRGLPLPRSASVDATLTLLEAAARQPARVLPSAASGLATQTPIPLEVLTAPLPIVFEHHLPVDLFQLGQALRQAAALLGERLTLSVPSSHLYQAASQTALPIYAAKVVPLAAALALPQSTEEECWSKSWILNRLDSGMPLSGSRFMVERRPALQGFLHLLEAQRVTVSPRFPQPVVVAEHRDALQSDGRLVVLQCESFAHAIRSEAVAVFHRNDVEEVVRQLAERQVSNSALGTLVQSFAAAQPPSAATVCAALAGLKDLTHLQSEALARLLKCAHRIQSNDALEMQCDGGCYRFFEPEARVMARLRDALRRKGGTLFSLPDGLSAAVKQELGAKTIRDFKEPELTVQCQWAHGLDEVVFRDEAVDLIVGPASSFDAAMKAVFPWAGRSKTRLRLLDWKGPPGASSAAVLVGFAKDHRLRQTLLSLGKATTRVVILHQD
jgi:DNA polymerase III epsilon subunit-like protein